MVHLNYTFRIHWYHVVLVTSHCNLVIKYCSGSLHVHLEATIDLEINYLAATILSVAVIIYGL